MSLPLPPAQLPYKLRPLLKDPEVLEFFNKWLRSTYFLWAGFEKNVGFYGTDPVSQGAALTASLTTITHTEPGTPDYAIQNLTNVSPYGFVTQDEGNSVLKVIKNLQTRIDELEARLDSTTGTGLIE